MGKEQSKPAQQVDLSLNHPRFTNAKVVSQEKQSLMQTVMGVDNKQYQKWKERLHKYPSVSQSQHLLLPIREKFASKGLCGQSGSLTLDFPNFPYLLTQQIAHRKGKKRLIQENQLWYLLFAILKAKKDMQPPFSKIGDVRPHNIFLNEEGVVKVANTFSWPRQTTNFTKAFDNEITYLAPQEVKQLEMGVAQSSKNDNSELFSIGLTLLSAATLQDFSDAYDTKKHTINLNRINDKLNEFKLNRAYSDIMKGTICNLCEFDQNKRVTSQQLWNWIAPHQQHIKARQNFYFPSAPQKIHHQVATVRHSVAQLTGHHNQNLQGTRQSGFGGTKLNFPPPVVRTGFADIPNSTPAESLYIPAPSSNTSSNTKQPSYSGVPISSSNTYQYTSQFDGSKTNKIDNTTQQASQSSKFDSVSKKDIISSKPQNEVTPPK